MLLRHPPVAKAWAGRCYGVSDMGWSREGLAMARSLAATMRADVVVHSGLRRTRRLAGMLRGAAIEDVRWRERDFGTWEGRRWDAIWRESGDAMDGLMTDPDGFRPGGGETGAMLAGRVMAAWEALPPADTVLVIAHGGPIASLRCLLAGAPLTEAVRFIPACGEMVDLPR
ncbi:histidine phosphatase family protein [Sphingomonas sp.]|uniref:histidine phosphatase family protein n=1 Tax=Sphingomonas sp. TaxID=28214 RepID=UPI0035AE0E8D